MSIFILEDDAIQAARLERTIHGICEQQHIAYDFIFSTRRGERIIERIADCIRTPIYFLDIEISGEKLKGFEIAQQIRKYDMQGIIVFITTHSEFAPISYKYLVSALGFLDKGMPAGEKHAMLLSCMQEYERMNRHHVPQDDFIINNEQATVRVPFKDVQYIMTSGPHRLELVAAGRLVQFYGKLKELEHADERLVRCHQSYIVNLEQITEMDMKTRQLMLANGGSIPVSRRLATLVRKKWLQLLEKG